MVEPFPPVAFSHVWSIFRRAGVEVDLEIVPNCLLIWNCCAGGDKILDRVGHTAQIAKTLELLQWNPF